ncbi:MAG: HRDC domain-containing protein [Saprospirales bacterium]|jgi:superfamily II DNA helicase RecQ|nr:HRDC domain-containing protein [Saprospirales bacterium]MBK8922108.1 HRDC domain-containing protein [Saprospirales bacterium]
MKIKLFTIPILGGEQLTEELNFFLRTKKILEVEQQLTRNGQSAFWCLSIKYLDDLATEEKQQQKTDYRKVLDEPVFRRFAQLREIRKRLSAEEKTPPYVIFTDAELASLALSLQLTDRPDGGH